MTRHGEFRHTYIDGNDIKALTDHAVLTLYDVKGAAKREILVDLADIKKVSAFRWFCYGEYAAREIGAKKKQYLHHFLIGRKKGVVVDHINTDKNDNRRANLRHVSFSDNNSNRKELSGVIWDQRTKSWAATLEKNGKRKWLGRYKDRTLAIKARAAAEVDILGHNTPGTLKTLKEASKTP